MKKISTLVLGKITALSIIMFYSNFSQASCVNINGVYQIKSCVKLNRLGMRVDDQNPNAESINAGKFYNKDLVSIQQTGCKKVFFSTFRNEQTINNVVDLPHYSSRFLDEYGETVYEKYYQNGAYVETTKLRPKNFNGELAITFQNFDKLTIEKYGKRDIKIRYKNVSRGISLFFGPDFHYEKTECIGEELKYIE